MGKFLIMIIMGLLWNIMDYYEFFMEYYGLL